MNAANDGGWTDTEQLAESLELWALRREKVLAMIDVRAAKKARKLACTCRLLADAQEAAPVSEAWKAEWIAACDEAAALLAEGAPDRSQPSRDDAPLSSRVTRSFDVAALLEDRPTRVVPVLLDVEVDLEFDLDFDVDLDEDEAPTRIRFAAPFAQERVA